MKHSIRLGALLVCLALLAMLPAALFAADVKTLSAGVGVEGREPHPEYSLLIIFANAKGQLVANVSVEVTESGGAVVLKTVSAGSWLFMGLEPGEYKVTATLGSRTTGASVTVPQEGQQKVWLAL